MHHYILHYKLPPVAMHVVQGRGHSSGVQSIRDNFANAFIAGSCYWPFVNIVNFRFVSGDKRILLASSAAVLYNAFLRWPLVATS